MTCDTALDALLLERLNTILHRWNSRLLVGLDTLLGSKQVRHQL